MLKSLLRKIVPEPVIGVYHLVLAYLANLLYGRPSEKLIVIGVTGTNGKSTTTSFIGQLLEHAGHRVGWMSTATMKIAGKEWLNDFKMTMLGRFKLQKMLKEMVDAGCAFAVVETSSQGILQHRHIAINYDVAVFTNLTPEHIEAHGGFENYKAAKLKLFHHLTQKPHKVIHGANIPKIIVANGEDPYAKEFLSQAADKKIAFVVDPDVEITTNGSTFHALGLDMELPLPGRFNVENTLAAISVVKEFGLTPEQIQDGVAHLKGAPGRLERIEEGQPFTVIVDQAPEPVAMKKVYETVDTLEKQRIIHVLGSCGGGRDVVRRPILGRIAGTNADLCIITNEDPYDDDPLEIMEQVAAGAREVGKRDGVDLFIVPDRGEAIQQAIHAAAPGDLVLITGKGCEQAIAVANGVKIPWDDRAAARSSLHKLLYGSH